ncbi:MAG: DNA replication and repair protein RecF [Clostridiales bacterium]|nr:DNA replication and repair protein RecF [Clostridiales bacterium]
MKIYRHSAENFRNISKCELTFHDEMNIIYGENGQGKTNLIESIWIMTGFYSFRCRKNSFLIKQGKEKAKTKTLFFSQGREQTAEMIIGEKKELTLNGVKEASPRAMTGRFPAVVFSPGTLSVIKNGPGERRKLVDMALSQIKPNYAGILSNYIKVVDSRNAMLKKYGEKCFDMLYFSTLDEQLVSLGAKIIKYRLEYIEKLSKESGEIYGGISSEKEKFAFYYDFSRDSLTESGIEERLKKEIFDFREKDVKYLYTSAGPHTHDISLFLDGKDARSFASQGQQRSCALALKLGEANLMEKYTGEKPVIMLDDVMSELDEKRQSFILNFLDGQQVFLTCCDISQTLRGKKGKVFKIENGGLV